ncbi:MAG: hypothetical protein KDD62_15275 [Bdellovibrionales bacterium]|nr:hypothetical protein [Bdellovibrionales bacterium]
MNHLTDEILERYLHHECDDVTLIESHLSACAECRAMLEGLKEFSDSLRTEYATGTSQQFVDAVMQRIQPSAASVSAVRRPGFFQALREWGLQGTAIAWSLLVIWVYSVPQATAELGYLLENAEVHELESEYFALNPNSDQIFEEYVKKK